MKKVMISQPMDGKMGEEIVIARKRAAEELKARI